MLLAKEEQLRCCNFTYMSFNPFAERVLFRYFPRDAKIRMYACVCVCVRACACVEITVVKLPATPSYTGWGGTRYLERDTPRERERERERERARAAASCLFIRLRAKQISNFVVM